MAKIVKNWKKIRSIKKYQINKEIIISTCKELIVLIKWCNIICMIIGQISDILGILLGYYKWY